MSITIKVKRNKKTSLNGLYQIENRNVKLILILKYANYYLTI